MTTPAHRFILLALLTASLTGGLLSPLAFGAAIPSDDFSLEVSPSTLAATVKPGVPHTLELKVHNAGKKTEELKIEARGFTIAHPSQTISITNSTPADLAEWIDFSKTSFSIAPGEWLTQKITVALPEAAGFSYPFAVVISRADQKVTVSDGRLLQGSIGVFTLVNVDKPGATRILEIESLKTDHGFYEYLPSKLTLKLKNTGNSIVQPYGNIYVQRHSNDPQPLAVLPVNESRGYILPENSKEFTAIWDDGFPHYTVSSPDSGGKVSQDLVWNLQQAGGFRIGRYTAKVVAVYNDGTRDVPIMAEVSFWVIPWRILLGLLVVVALVGFAIWSIVRKIIRAVRRKKS